MKACDEQEIQLHVFLNLDLRWRRWTNAPRAILTPRKGRPAPTEQDDECAPELVLTFWKKNKILFRIPGIEHRYFGRLARSLVTIPTGLSRLNGSTRIT
jgi:hypothetical protein